MITCCNIIFVQKHELFKNRLFTNSTDEKDTHYSPAPLKRGYPTLIKTLLTISLFLVSTATFSNELGDAATAMRLGDYAEAYCQLKPLAQAGNNEAQYTIGWMYHNGYGLRVNDNLALEWWIKASEQGNTDASFSIAMLYNQGEGPISKNLTKAVDYYLLATADKHNEANVILRSMLMRNDKAIQGRKQQLINQHGKLFGPQLQIRTHRVNVRQAPSLKGRIITRLAKNHRVIQLHKQGNWSQVGIIDSPSDKQTIGWIYSRLLKPYVKKVATVTTSLPRPATTEVNKQQNTSKTATYTGSSTPEKVVNE